MTRLLRIPNLEPALAHRHHFVVGIAWQVPFHGLICGHFLISNCCPIRFISIQYKASWTKPGGVVSVCAIYLLVYSALYQLQRFHRLNCRAQVKSVSHTAEMGDPAQIWQHPSPDCAESVQLPIEVSVQNSSFSISLDIIPSCLNVK